LPAPRVKIRPLSGRVHDTLGARVRHSLFPRTATPEEREQARRALVLEIQQREGEDAKVDVQVGPDGQEVRVRVTKEKTGAAEQGTPLYGLAALEMGNGKPGQVGRSLSLPGMARPWA
jgi:hypothetical protein